MRSPSTSPPILEGTKVAAPLPVSSTTVDAVGAEGDAQMASSVITAMTLQGLFAQQQQSAVGPNSRVIQLTTTTPAVTVGQGGAPHLGTQTLTQTQLVEPHKNVRAMQRIAREKQTKRTAVVFEECLDTETAKRRRRMVKNRESAARSRQKKQNQLEGLEKQVKSLTSENRVLRMRISELERGCCKQDEN